MNLLDFVYYMIQYTEEKIKNICQILLMNKCLSRIILKCLK
nr:MAG TPA_asm: hypothetical protein [Caudoviricetes sp.]DAT74765.1 MAG TPA: hypothetical protein [Caudoviricetes sp.]